MTRKYDTHIHATYRTLNSCFDLIGSHQQCTPKSPPLEIEPTTTVCRSQNSTSGHWFMSHISNAELTSHGDNA